MKSPGSGIHKPTTLTMLSGLATIVAATLALGSMAQDRSGQSTAMVSKSFRTELGANDHEFELIPLVNDNSRDVDVAKPHLPGRLVMSFGQVKDNVDPAREFASLLPELERIAGRCTADAPVREVRIDVFYNDPESVTSLVEQACQQACHTSEDRESLLLREGVHVEIQTWAASPTQAAWIDAVREASRLRDGLNAEFSQANSPQFLISSSAALWPYADRMRPAMTIVFGFPIAEQTVF